MTRTTTPPTRPKTHRHPNGCRSCLPEHPKLVLRRPGGLSGVPRTRSHLELGRQTHQRPWYCVSRHGRVGRRQACPAQDTTFPRHTQRFGAGWSSPVARQAHNLKVAGSNPAPATKSQHHTTYADRHAARRPTPRGLFDVGRAALRPHPSASPVRSGASSRQPAVPRGEGLMWPGAEAGRTAPILHRPPALRRVRRSALRVAVCRK